MGGRAVKLVDCEARGPGFDPRSTQVPLGKDLYRYLPRDGVSLKILEFPAAFGRLEKATGNYSVKFHSLE